MRYLIIRMILLQNICRCIISHDTIEKVDKIADQNQLKNGFMTMSMFEKLCQNGEKETNAENIKTYLVALGLAVEAKDDLLFIPALVSDENKV